MCQKGGAMQYLVVLLCGYIFNNPVTYFLTGQSAVSSLPHPTAIRINVANLAQCW